MMCAPADVNSLLAWGIVVVADDEVLDLLLLPMVDVGGRARMRSPRHWGGGWRFWGARSAHNREEEAPAPGIL